MREEIDYDDQNTNHVNKENMHTRLKIVGISFLPI